MSKTIITPADVVFSILIGKNRHAEQPFGLAMANTNIALVKYWGKRDENLHLPYQSSISLATCGYGTATKISYETTAQHDRYFLNDTEIAIDSAFATRLIAFLDLFRSPGEYFRVVSNTNLPIAAGCASSASGFAALVLALNDFYRWELTPKELSILARLGSGSAARSVFSDAGAVMWHCGTLADGFDSYGEVLQEYWPELRVGLLILSKAPKVLSSSAAMRCTVETAQFNYDIWCNETKKDFKNCLEALHSKDFSALGAIIENNSAALHRLLKCADPVINYSSPETLLALAKIQKLRHQGIEVYATQDAGPNLHLIFQKPDEEKIRQQFSNIEIAPVWGDVSSDELVLVDEQDRAIGTKDKLAVHRAGDLHRAFSVILWRSGTTGLELLLQQRSSTKYHSANLWSNACCGHPRPDEVPLLAAKRRLYEELGISCELTAGPIVIYRAELRAERMVEYEFDHLFFGEIAALPQNYNALEVQNCRWIMLDYLKAELAENSRQYSAWLPFLLAAIIKYRYESCGDIELKVGK